MAEQSKDAGQIDANLMQGLLKLSGTPASAPGGGDLALSRMTPDDRARALDLAATLIRQARREATGNAAVAEGEEEVPAKPAPRVPVRSEASESKVRELLFRGVVYKFKRTGVTNNGHVGVVGNWQTEIEAEGEDPFTLMVEEFVDGRFSPFEGVVFKDFVQAAIVGVVAGSFQAKWLHAESRHRREHRRLILVVLPLVAAFAMLVGIAIGLRLG